MKLMYRKSGGIAAMLCHQTSCTQREGPAVMALSALGSRLTSITLRRAASPLLKGAFMAPFLHTSSRASSTLLGCIGFSSSQQMVLRCAFLSSQQRSEPQREHRKQPQQWEGRKMPLVLPSELQQQEGGSASSRGKGEVPPSECGEDLIAVKGLAPPLTKAHGHDATALEKHVSFWDRRKTGVIYPLDSYNGLRALGFNSIFSVAVALAFHILHASYWTSTSWVPNLLWPVYVKRIHRAKHGSDTETYNVDGRFVPDKFQEIFQRYDKDGKGGLTYRELLGMMAGNRNAGDLLGWSFQFFLWSSLWLLAADPVTGVVSRQDILAHYDGTLYYRIEERRRKGEKLPWWRWGTGIRGVSISDVGKEQ